MIDFDVVELPPADHPEVGDRAPDFTRPLVGPEYWEDASLTDLTDEGPVLLVFYGFDGAFPATYVWNELRDRAVEAGRDLQVVGVGPSGPYSHGRLIEERAIDYRLFSDPTNEVAERYGLVHDLDGMAGLAEPRPATLLLDGDRRVNYAWAAGEWPAFPDYDALEAAVDEHVPRED
jgi:peroxiredoxin